MTPHREQQMIHMSYSQSNNVSKVTLKCRLSLKIACCGLWYKQTVPTIGYPVVHRYPWEHFTLSCVRWTDSTKENKIWIIFALLYDVVMPSVMSQYIMKLSNGSISRVSGPFFFFFGGGGVGGRSIGHRWFPFTKLWRTALMFSLIWSALEQTVEQTIDDGGSIAPIMTPL